MYKLNYLNVGCGNKFHKEWFNIDLVSNSFYVKSYNLFKGIPFPDNHFEVVYHSQVLEHFPKEKADFIIKECFRVLKPGGIMRVVVPDLENIAREYLKLLNENITNPSIDSAEKYEWIMLEMYDQCVRNNTGGQMAEFLRQPHLVNEQYIFERIGYVGKEIRKNYLPSGTTNKKRQNFITIHNFIKKGSRFFLNKIVQLLCSTSQKIGMFRLSGEIHYWMYDRYSLSKLLKSVGFESIEVKTPFESNIPRWEEYELDVKNGEVFDPTSLHMEARKGSLICD